MNFTKFPFFVAFILMYSTQSVFSQQELKINFSGLAVVDHDWVCPNCQETEIGGLSGITLSKQLNEYFLVADKPPARFYVINLDLTKGINPSFRSTIFLSPKKGEMEALRLRPNTSNLYVTDERNDETFLWYYNKMQVNDQTAFELPEKFEDIDDNSGFEGLCFSNDGKKAFLSMERPLKSEKQCLANDSIAGITRFVEIDLETNQAIKEYGYPIHSLDHIAKNDNGVSEIEFWNKDTLLVVERTYFRSLNKNGVRIFMVDMKGASDISEISTCAIDSTHQLLDPQLIFDFENPIEAGALERVDNVEGMTLSHDRKNLILVTDNNFRGSQQSQIIVLDIEPLTPNH